MPLGFKLAYLAWLAVWVPLYWIGNGPSNFLWMCDGANLIVGLAVWIESPLLVSSQAAGVFLVQVVWTLDFLARLATGHHLVGGTEYMFDAAQPLWLRGLSLFHAAMPVVLAWLVVRLGYDRRGWWLQSAWAVPLLAASYLVGTPEENLNWVWAPFGVPQTLVAPPLWVAACMVLYPLVVFWPTHRALAALVRRVPGARLLP